MQASPPIQHPPYTGNPKDELNAPLTVAEVRVAIQRLNTRSTWRLDITNKILPNLVYLSVVDVPRLFNECWESRSIRERWRTAKAIPISKPGKRPHSRSSSPYIPDIMFG
ncbi:hypothetical protein HPB48_001420 [Haemaphysalis longicornis]|uniref:Uncharacterized protein n=1 Tax=Haemaphysalis longicornis TaxID=44386 RepID=A0A9J6GYS1_HAELO|nr:hypothetical protein HPB48_001420 [Haemaphysalis longicornis]